MNNENQFFTTYEETEDWLKDMGIKNYTINDDLTVNVDDNVYIENKMLNYIPVQFKKVLGYFYCYNNNLTTLKGSPNVVEGYFDGHNNKLNSLKHLPQKISGNVYVYNNQISSFKNIKSHIGNSFYCFGNPITDFSNLDLKIKGRIYFTPIEGMEYLEKYKTISNDIYINFEELKKLQNLKKLNDKLDNDLFVASNVIKKIKI